MIEVANVDERGLLKIKHQIQLPEKPNAVGVTQLLRIDEFHVLVVNRRRYLYILNVPTASIVGSFDYPQPYPEGANWPTDITIKDAVILDSKNGKVAIALAIENIGIGIVECSHRFEFSVLQEYNLEDTISIGKGPKAELLVFTNREKKFFVYCTRQKKVVRSIIISDHNGVSNEYSRPIPVPTAS